MSEPTNNLPSIELPLCPVCLSNNFDATGNCLSCNPPGYNGGSEVQILASPMVPIRCSDCGCETASAYYVKRRRSFYAMLCFQQGKGCWERSSKTLCQHVGEYGAQCFALEEFEVVYGNNASKMHVCADHIRDHLSDHDEIRIYPIDK